MSRRRNPNKSTIHTPILMSDDITHSNNSMNVRNLVSRLLIRFPHPIQRLTEDFDLPFDSGTQHQVRQVLLFTHTLRLIHRGV